MEPLNDDELKHALKQWQAPAAPASLERKVLGRDPWWRWLMTGSVRVPVPVGMAVIAAVAAFVYWTSVQQGAPPKQRGSLTLADFQPVEKLELRIVRNAHEGN